jgi:hypothetical protein
MFSEHEKMVLKILGRRKMTVQEISDTFYHSRQVPLADRNYVAGILRRIEAKCEKEDLDWTLLSEGTGRGGKTVWRGKHDVRNSTKRST